MKFFSKLDCVKFIANLHLIGIKDNKKIFSQLRKWLKYRKELLSIVAGSENSVASIYRKYGFSRKETSGTDSSFFISFHYGFYPILLDIIVREYNFSYIQFVIHEHNNDIRALQSICRKFDCKVEFVPVDEKGRFVRKLIKGKKAGAAVFMMVDLPVSNGNSTVSQISLFNKGQLSVIDGFLRIAELLKCPPRLLYQSPDENGRLTLIEQQVTSTEEVFKHFETLVVTHPYLWERLHDLHSFFEMPDKTNHVTVTFRSTKPGEYFLYNSQDNKVFRIGEAFFRLIKNYQAAPLLEDQQAIKEGLSNKFKVNHVV